MAEACAGPAPAASGSAPLPAAELAARLDRILASAEAIIASVPVPYVEHRGPDGRTLRELAYHVFRLALGFADGMDLGAFAAGWLGNPVPGDLKDGAAIARYGALVRGRVGGWFDGAGPSEYARAIDAPAGPCSGHALLEQITRHAAWHLRQLHALGEEIGVAPSPPGDIDGLSLPASLW